MQRLSLLFAYIFGVEMQLPEYVVVHCRKEIKTVRSRRQPLIREDEVAPLRDFAAAHKEEPLLRFCAEELALYIKARADKAIAKAIRMIGGAIPAEVEERSLKVPFELPGYNIPRGGRDREKALQMLHEMPEVHAALEEYHSNGFSETLRKALPSVNAALFCYSLIVGDLQLDQFIREEFIAALLENKKGLYHHFMHPLLNQVWRVAFKTDNQTLKCLCISILRHHLYYRTAGFSSSDIVYDLEQYAQLPWSFRTHQLTQFFLTPRFDQGLKPLVGKIAFDNCEIAGDIQGASPSTASPPVITFEMARSAEMILRQQNLHNLVMRDLCLSEEGATMIFGLIANLPVRSQPGRLHISGVIFRGRALRY